MVEPGGSDSWWGAGPDLLRGKFASNHGAIAMSAGLELLTTDEMAEVDRLTAHPEIPGLSGIATLSLMENAGRAVAEEAMKMVPVGAQIAVLCGPGNNGGDGSVAARLLRERGYGVRVASLVPQARLSGDALAMSRLWTGLVELMPDTHAPNAIDGAALVIDAMFGAGLKRPLEKGAAAILANLEDGRRNGSFRILAVDVPSGVDGTTGAVVGDGAVTADRTITFFRRKPGQLLMPASQLCGNVVVAEIGITPVPLLTIRPKTFANAPALWRDEWPVLDRSGHKYTRGHAVIVSGGSESTGAARLGARGALRVGAGLVTVVGSPAATMINAAHLTAIMTRSVAGAPGLGQLLSDARLNAVLIGPGAGVGPETAALARTALATKAAVVIDADAITSFAGGAPDVPRASGSIGFLGRTTEAGATPSDLFAAIAANAQRPVVLTPHEGEFKRLFGDVSGSKLDRARAAAKLSGAVIVLKGPDTVIASPDGRAAINENAPPWLATAGSGDVLAGFVTGLLAQQMPAFEAACAAVWLHGECANAFGPGLIAEDLAEALPAVLAALGGDPAG